MSSKKHTTSAVDLNKPYEQNEIELKGIFGFAIGLFLLIVVTFGLMWALLNVLNDYHVENAGPANPMLMTDQEQLPPEPRLQSAPGFGVEGPGGRVNLELGAPQAEYRVVHDQWRQMWEHGLTDEKSGTTTVMPIEQAKAKLLTQNVKAKSGPETHDLLTSSRTNVSDSSSGRVASEKRR
jgi:hypothetical protein